jgi:hypothetical protein
MPLNEIPTFLHPEIRRLIDSALEQAWLELCEERADDEVMARRRLATTIVALAGTRRCRPIQPIGNLDCGGDDTTSRVHGEAPPRTADPPRSFVSQGVAH